MAQQPEIAPADLSRLVEAARMEFEARHATAGRGNELSYEDRQALCESVVHKVLREEAVRRVGGTALTPEQEAVVADAIELELFDGMDRLFALMGDATITDVIVRGNDQVLLKHVDRTDSTGARLVATDAGLESLVQRFGREQGVVERPFDFANPELSVRLDDGSRLFALGFGVSSRPVLIIRRNLFPRCDLTVLADQGYFPPSMVDYFAELVGDLEANVLICGGQSVGKSHFLRGCASAIPNDDVTVTIETDLELGLNLHPDVYPRMVIDLEARRPNMEGKGEVTCAQQVANALRCSARRIIVGEVRGGEAGPMLEALTSGGKGGMATVHANGPQEALRRLGSLARQGSPNVTWSDVMQRVSDAIHVVVHLEPAPRRAGGYVAAIHEVVGFDGEHISTEVLYEASVEEAGVTRLATGTDGPSAFNDSEPRLPRRLRGAKW